MSESPRGGLGAPLFALTLCFTGATIAVGWWGVPVIGLIWGVWGARYARPGTMIAPLAAASAVTAWAGLLIWTSTRGPLALLATTLGAVIGVPAAALIAITLGFAAVLAWSAAAVVPTPVPAGETAACRDEAAGAER